MADAVPDSETAGAPLASAKAAPAEDAHWREGFQGKNLDELRQLGQRLLGTHHRPLDASEDPAGQEEILVEARRRMQLNDELAMTRRHRAERAAPRAVAKVGLAHFFYVREHL